jgi:hypothetical protein
MIRYIAVDFAGDRFIIRYLIVYSNIFAQLRMLRLVRHLIADGDLCFSGSQAPSDSRASYLIRAATNSESLKRRPLMT